MSAGDSSEKEAPSTTTPETTSTTNNTPTTTTTINTTTTDATEPTDPSTQLEGEALAEAIRQQIEFFLTREYLATDSFLVSQMSPDMYLPIAALAPLCTFAADIDFIAEALRSSTTVTVHENGAFVKPNLVATRNTIILREIPSDTDLEKVKAIFNEDFPPVSSVWGDVGDTWFVAFQTEEDALKALEIVRTKTFNDSPIKARIKSENIIRSLYCAGEGGRPEGGSATSVGMFGYPPYYNPIGYTFGPRSLHMPTFYGGYEGERRGRGQPRQRKDFRKANAGGGQGGNSDGRRRRSRSGRRTNEAFQSGGHNGGKGGSNPSGAQLQLGLAHFPPLTASAESNKKSNVKTGYSSEFTKYKPTEIIDIISQTDISAHPFSFSPTSLSEHCSVLLTTPVTTVVSKGAATGSRGKKAVSSGNNKACAESVSPSTTEETKSDESNKVGDKTTEQDKKQEQVTIEENHRPKKVREVPTYAQIARSKEAKTDVGA